MSGEAYYKRRFSHQEKEKPVTLTFALLDSLYSTRDGELEQMRDELNKLRSLLVAILTSRPELRSLAEAQVSVEWEKAE